MGGVSVGGGGGGGKKSVDSEVNMVPFIDLLLSIISFLLMTAVWVQSGSLQAQQPRGAPSPDSPPQDTPTEQLKIHIGVDGMTVGTTQADTRPISSGPRKLDELRGLLGERHNSNPQQREVWIQPEGAVNYVDIIEVMDVVYEIWGANRAPGQHVRDVITIRFL